MSSQPTATEEKHEAKEHHKHKLGKNIKKTFVKMEHGVEKTFVGMGKSAGALFKSPEKPGGKKKVSPAEATKEEVHEPLSVDGGVVAEGSENARTDTRTAITMADDELSDVLQEQTPAESGSDAKTETKAVRATESGNRSIDKDTMEDIASVEKSAEKSALPPENTAKQHLHQILLQVTKHYIRYRQTIVHDTILPKLPPSILKLFADITDAINLKLTKQGVKLECEDVISIGLGVIGPLVSCVSFCNPSLVFIVMEICFTFLYPLAITFNHLESKRHDKIPYCLSYWILLCFTHILEPLVRFKSFIPRTYACIKSLAGFGLMNPKMEYMPKFYLMVVEEHIMKRQMGLEGKGLKQRRELMHADNEAVKPSATSELDIKESKKVGDGITLTQKETLTNEKDETIMETQPVGLVSEDHATFVTGSGSDSGKESGKVGEDVTTIEQTGPSDKKDQTATETKTETVQETVTIEEQKSFAEKDVVTTEESPAVKKVGTLNTQNVEHAVEKDISSGVKEASATEKVEAPVVEKKDSVGADAPVLVEQHPVSLNAQ